MELTRMAPAPRSTATAESEVQSFLRSPSTPPSGVRQSPGVPATSYIPPRPTFDSDPQPTRIHAPDPSLLAMTREAERLRRRWHPATWFALGLLTGALAVWSAARNVASDVYVARQWVASELRSLHAMTGPSDPGPAANPSVAPAPATVAEAPPPAPPPTTHPAPVAGAASRAPSGAFVTIAPSPPPTATSPAAR